MLLMSQNGQSHRSDDVPSTSALAPRTDIISATDGVRKLPGSAIQLVYRSGRQTTKSNRLTTIKPARTHIATQLLVRDRCARRARQRENIEASEFGLRDAQRVARSLIIVGDPFLRGRVPMMGVVEVFPGWPPSFAFTLLS
jgi:hypothetical protein